MQKIIITGGCGFIGSNFLNKFVPLYPEIQFINIDLLTYAGSLNNLLPSIKTAPNYAFFQIDIRNIQAVRELYEKEQPTDCIHFAAESHVDNSILNPNIFLETNILGTNNLLMLHKEYKLQRFHFISTDEVYGDLPLEDKKLKFSETTPLQPHSPYSVSKASADMLVQAYHRTYGLDTTTTRCSNNYGPRQHKEKLIPRFISELHAGRKVPLYGDGKNVRDWIHVDDHNEGVWEVFAKGDSGAIYNLGGMNELSNRAITTVLLDCFNKSESSIEFVTDRLGHDRRYAIDCRKIMLELDRQPKINFSKGLVDTIRWYTTQ